MPKTNSPRRGSMQVWPRKRSSRTSARIRSWPESKEEKLLGFAAFKAGMTHIIIKDEHSTSLTKGMNVPVPVTVLECPPIKVIGVRLYKKNGYGIRCVGQITVEKLDKELSKKITIPKKSGGEANTDNLSDVRIIAISQPKLVNIGRKTPDILELGLGGESVEKKLEFGKSLLGKEVSITDVFKEGEFVDSFSITKGKGNQGPVKRFGVDIRVHKSEKTKRGPGSLGPWTGDRTYRVAHAGQMGFHQRTESNKQILFFGDDPSRINPKGGFINYGLLKNPYILIKGGLGGKKKRLVTLTVPRRSAPAPAKAPSIVYTSLTSQQG